MLSANAHNVQNQTVQTFLKGLFDYAGLFPPASLPLDQAIEEYAGYRTGADQWMIGPFVISASSLDQLDVYERFFDSSNPFRLSVLFRSELDPVKQVVTFQEDLAQVLDLERRQKKGVIGEMIEMRVQESIFSDPAQSISFVQTLQQIIQSSGSGVSSVFLEVMRGPAFNEQISRLADALINALPLEPRVGMKIRCGGMEESDYPSANELAEFIDTVAKRHVPFKATAGLHHPVRHFNSHAAVTMHGFLNVFFAAALSAALRLDMDTIRAIIAETDPNAFSFSPDAISWRNLSMGIEQLDFARQAIACSIGSCSFDEPRQDLENLGWLRAADQ